MEIYSLKEHFGVLHYIIEDDKILRPCILDGHLVYLEEDKILKTINVEQDWKLRQLKKY